MKTNMIMIRNNPAFIQRTKDGYFNATKLIQNWNSEKSYKERLLLGNYQKNKSTKDFVEQLKLEGVDNPVIASKGRNGGTWVHPKILIDLAMWIDVKFKSMVIDYVLDGLIASRCDAGDYYNEMSAQILDTYVDTFGRKPNPTIYINESRRIKSLLGISKKDRNVMSENELANITAMQKFNTILIKDKIGKKSRQRLMVIHAKSLQL